MKTQTNNYYMIILDKVEWVKIKFHREEMISVFCLLYTNLKDFEIVIKKTTNCARVHVGKVFLT